MRLELGEGGRFSGRAVRSCLSAPAPVSNSGCSLAARNSASRLTHHCQIEERERKREKNEM